FIQIEDHPAAGTWFILLVWEDILAKVFPYVDDTTQASIRKAVRVGIGKDGQPYEMVVRAHAQIIGKSTSGKSSLLNVLIAWLTRCIDAVPWACGVQKLYDLVGPWVDPYMDLDEDLPFDWIASGPQDVLEMLA